MTSAHRSHAVCVHGHFYQPPRENPWTGKISVQPSAAPFHDWNARVTHECYAPNAWARILDEHESILEITNNYQHISFNIGPTLLSWLEVHRSDVYDAILKADRLGQRHFSGHGPALAQVYHHLIMPLANTHDQRTQVIWGVRDFEARFGRKPEGMWLAETAVDLATLEALAEQDIKFTILAPHQAARVRDTHHLHQWEEIENQDNLDTSKAYVQNLASGKSIAIFFYDGPTSRAVAFEGLLDDGKRFADRLMSSLCVEDEAPQLAHIATDGESYGHHHTYGEMALAYALDELLQRPNVELTIYGEWLARHPPHMEVEIAQQTSWSCAHGVERWRTNCGCHTGGAPGSNQSWRSPLRAALDHVRDTVNASYTTLASALFKDMWGARDRYIDVLLDAEQLRPFCEREYAGQGHPDEAERALMVKWMELQRHVMMMYTSCGWFFHDLAGIETVQILRYAARVMELYKALDGEAVEEGFFEHLRKAQTHDGRTGEELFYDEVKPLMGGRAQNISDALEQELHDVLLELHRDPSSLHNLTHLHDTLLLCQTHHPELRIEPYQTLYFRYVKSFHTSNQAVHSDEGFRSMFNKVLDLMNLSHSFCI